MKCALVENLPVNQFSTVALFYANNFTFTTFVQIPKKSDPCPNTYDFRLNNQLNATYPWQATLEGSTDWQAIPNVSTNPGSPTPEETVLEASWAGAAACTTQTFDVTVIQFSPDLSRPHRHSLPLTHQHIPLIHQQRTNGNSSSLSSLALCLVLPSFFSWYSWFSVSCVDHKSKRRHCSQPIQQTSSGSTHDTNKSIEQML